MPKETLHFMLQQSLTAESPMNKFRRALDDDERQTLDAILGATKGFKPYVESTGELSCLESVLLVTALRQSQKIERLEILLQRLTVRVLELYASQDHLPEPASCASHAPVAEHSV